MRWQYGLSCVLAAVSLLVFPELSLAHGGGGGGHGGGGGGGGHGFGGGLAVMVLAHRAQVLADAALVRDSAGRMDLRVEGFLVGEIAVASVIGVSVGEIAAFAVGGFAIST